MSSVAERLDQALDPTTQADVAAVMLHEGLAHICLLTPAMTLVRAKIDMQVGNWLSLSLTFSRSRRSHSHFSTMLALGLWSMSRLGI